MNLEREKKVLQIKRAKHQVEELEFKILEHMSEVERLKKHIQLQEETIINLEKELN